MLRSGKRMETCRADGEEPDDTVIEPLAGLAADETNHAASSPQPTRSQHPINR